MRLASYYCSNPLHRIYSAHDSPREGWSLRGARRVLETGRCDAAGSVLPERLQGRVPRTSDAGHPNCLERRRPRGGETTPFREGRGVTSPSPDPAESMGRMRSTPEECRGWHRRDEGRCRSHSQRSTACARTGRRSSPRPLRRTSCPQEGVGLRGAWSSLLHRRQQPAPSLRP